ncbi:lysophospholipid acyltransferase family protein [Fontisphaera persica]|uniref:lysophospholipid acyltransferase family protein n=1 Tax=Fontisphaera persica TaxID=2974023 RepID=UPI0024BF884E|nr:lysophospholipid acyltransferase family protein [Fontisphaera persica]WCJ58497.1 lysophospholipid acyltransferase family protein [Fontisphaera persica]
MPEPPAPMKPWYWLGWSLTRLVSHGYFGLTAYHPERVPARGPCIVAANHASYFDPFCLGAEVRRELYFLARSSAFRFPLSFLLPRVNAVPVDRDGGGMKGLLQIMDILAQGHAITLFPEGTRSPDGQLQRARPGIGLIVIKSGAPVVPVRIFGSYEAWNRHMKLPRPRRLQVKYGQPLNFEALRAEAPTASKDRLKAIYQEVADQIMAAIAALQPQRDEP